MSREGVAKHEPDCSCVPWFRRRWGTMKHFKCIRREKWERHPGLVKRMSSQTTQHTESQHRADDGGETPTGDEETLPHQGGSYHTLPLSFLQLIISIPHVLADCWRLADARHNNLAILAIVTYTDCSKVHWRSAEECSGMESVDWVRILPPWALWFPWHSTTSQRLIVFLGVSLSRPDKKKKKKKTLIRL